MKGNCSRVLATCIQVEFFTQDIVVIASHIRAVVWTHTGLPTICCIPKAFQPQTTKTREQLHQHLDKTTVFIAGQQRNLGQKQKKRLRRRNTIEPIIGHMKADGKLDRCFLKGSIGDAIHVILCAVGQNIRKLLRWLCFAWILATLTWLFRPIWAIDRARQACRSPLTVW